jgi:hypothetical protein
MKDFRAVTESGAVYEVIGNRVQISGSSLPNTYFTVYQMHSNAAPQGYPWKDPSWREVDIAVVGERLAVVGRDEWRISSEIASVEELSEDDLVRAEQQWRAKREEDRERAIRESLEEFVQSEAGPDPIADRKFEMEF